METSINNNNGSSIINGGSNNTINNNSSKKGNPINTGKDRERSKVTLITTICTIIGTIVAVAALFMNSK